MQARSKQSKAEAKCLKFQVCYVMATNLKAITVSEQENQWQGRAIAIKSEKNFSLSHPGKPSHHLLPELGQNSSPAQREHATDWLAGPLGLRSAASARFQILDEEQAAEIRFLSHFRTACRLDAKEGIPS